ncbi:hypothetical protein [Kitasatospora sp. NPDC017646]|uniref:hypothetical protein n=1 Tax=Kitasatospora sp. NPDC017646 TaxID=3364024 RepID=UPI0037B0E974
MPGRGCRAKGGRRLRSGPGLGSDAAPTVLALLLQGYALPADYARALTALRRLDAGLVTELTALLCDGRRDAAIRLLRDRTDVDLAAGRHPVTELGTELATELGTQIGTE